MRKKLLLLPIVGIIIWLALSSHSTIPYGGSGIDGTGATSGATACGSTGCHTSSSTLTVALELDSAGAPVTHYIAGQSYTIKITGTNTASGSIATYPYFGFQVTATTSASGGTTSPVNAGTLAVTGLPAGDTNSVHSGTFHIVEHNTPIIATSGTGGTSTTYVRSVPWTAPATSGTGSIKLYGCINAVNHDGTSSGDHYNSASPVTITELILPAVVGAIVGDTNVCVGSNTTLTDTSTGTWSISPSSIATVSGGVVHGVAAGTATVTFTSSFGGSRTRGIQVHALPGAITGHTSVCVGSIDTLTSSGAVTWTSTNTGVATVSTSGIVTGITAGTDIIVCGNSFGCTRNDTITVASPPSITGPTSVCIGSHITLSTGGSTGTSGAWSCSPSSVATIGATTGVVTPVSTGVFISTFTTASGCVTYRNDTVNTTPYVASIVGSDNVCVGSNITYTDSTSGGTWSINPSSVASIGISGVVTGTGAGTAIITYYNSNSCGSGIRTRTITVIVVPNAGLITGATTVCIGTPVSLSTTGQSGGVWYSAPASVATITSGGILTGAGSGIDTVRYTVTNYCGTSVATRFDTVTHAPGSVPAISGATHLCAGSTTTLFDATSGGTWSSSNTSIAAISTVGSYGILTGLAYGVDTVKYTVSNACGSAFTQRLDTVLPDPTITLGANPSVAQGTTAASLTYSATTFSPTLYSIVWSSGAITAGFTNVTNATLTTSPIVLVVPVAPAVGTYTGTLTVSNGYCSSTNYPISVTITAGNHPPSFVHGPIQSITICENSSATSLNTDLAILDSDSGQNVEWQVRFTPTHGTLSGLPAFVPTTGGVITPSAATYTPNIGFSGIDTIVVAADDLHNDTVYTFITVNVTPLPTVAAITGTNTICQGSTTTLFDATPAGTWSATNPGVASISSGGLVTGNSPGTSVILYTVANTCGSTFATDTITVNPLPNSGVISGTTVVCPSGITTLTESVSGGTWSSSIPSIATVNSSGVVTGVAAGTDVVSYAVTTSCGTAIATATITVNPDPSVAAITGLSTVCVGSTITLANTTSGGTWSSVFPSIASVSGTGVVTGLASGVDTIVYSFTNTCGTATARKVVTVNPLPDAGTITGGSTICTGSTGSLSVSSSGGTWSSSNTTVATVNATGVVTGVSTGSAIVSYVLSNSCGTGVATFPVTISTTPSAGTITGTTSVCTGTSATLSDATTGGTWTSSNPLVATIGSGSGIIIGVSAGTTVVTYVVSNSCGTASTTSTITVTNSPTSGSISGPSVVCTSHVITLSDGVSGGTWSSGTTSVAIVNAATGVVTGVSTGSVTISYVVSNSCGTATNTYPLTVNPSPNAGSITGASSVCLGATTDLADATTGGTWSTSNAAIASVTSSGVVTGAAAGNATISYSVTNSCGTANATKAMTVIAPPVAGVISGSSTVCATVTTTFTDTTSGGTWTSSNAAIATVSATGVVTGVTGGTASISYTVTNACGTAFTTKTITVNPAPDAGVLGGVTATCPGGTTTLTSTASGGVWSSSNISVATISSGGVVTGVSSGTSTITYVYTNTCGSASATTTVTVNAVPTAGSISGPVSVCATNTISLTDVIGGGVWSSSDAAVASISAVGLVTGVTAGSATITYTVTNSCGSAGTFYNITVNPMPAAGSISGITAFCQGATSTFSESASGGTWSSSAAGVATVSAAGVVTGVSGGSATISYSYSNSCGTSFTTTSVTISPLPNPGVISGASTVCIGSAITLTDGAAGGTWSATNGNASILPGGVVGGVSAGVDTIKYTVSNACASLSAIQVVNVISTASAGTISGPSTVCTGTPVTLSETISGGTWTSSNNTVATIDASGVVNGLTAGSVTMTYTISVSCGFAIATYPMTISVGSGSGTISGATTLCTGVNTTLTDATSGGVWSSSDATIASVSATGVVTGVAAGSATISYTVTSSCGSSSATSSMTVTTTATPGTISGAGSVCPGATLSLTETVSGGSWSSSNTAVATVSPAGVVTGVSIGSATISYISSSSCGTATATASVSVTASPSAGVVTGATSVCTGLNITLADGTSGGSWSSSNPAVASVSATGVVTGISAGSATISYTVTNTCGTASATSAVTVTNSAVAGSISGATTVCSGSSTTLTETASGGTWSSSNAAIATVNSAGVVTGVTAGSVTFSYTSVTACGSATATSAMTVTATPSSSPISGPASVCTSSSITLTNGASGGVWTSSNTAAATINSSTGVATGVAIGITTISYTVTNSCGTGIITASLSVFPSPVTGTISGASSVCVGAGTTLTDGASGGVWSSSNTTVATVSASGVVTGVGAGSATISYTVTTLCGSASATSAMTVNPTPSSSAISGATSVCVGANISLTDGISGGTWTSSNGAVASVSASGVVTGVSAGSATISYAVTNMCGTATVSSPVTVSVAPDAGSISGTTTFCSGTTSTLSNTASGGTWTSSNTAVATVDASGVVTGVSAGSATITYTSTTGCGTATSTAAVTINASPASGVISPSSIAVCTGATSTLTDPAVGGTWSSSNPAVATVSATGVVTGVATGSATISYTGTSASCGSSSATALVTVSPLAVAGTISGTTLFCSPTTSTLTDATSGGVWSSTNTSVATINPVTGVVTGVGNGVTTISYTVTSGCGSVAATTTLTVNPFPDAGVVIGIPTVCPGSTTSLADTTGGGVWSSGNPSIATVSATGLVTGVAVGVVNIYYSVTNICGTANATISVNVNTTGAGVSPITGAGAVCAGSSLTLADATLGGTYTSSNPAIATIGASSGIVTGVAGGTATITYTAAGTCGASTTTTTVTINPAPNAGTISGAATVCASGTTLLTESVSGGTWSSSNAAVATVSAAGLVSGVSAGSATITYTVTNSCGTATTTAPITVTAGPTAATVTGTTSLCSGATTTLTPSISGGTWTSGSPAIATVDPATGVVSGVATGTAAISYTITGSCGSIVTSTTVTINTLAGAGVIIGATGICVGANLSLTTTGSGGSWSSSDATVATVSSTGVVTGIASGAVVISYSSASTCGLSVATADVTVSAMPSAGTISGASAMCAGTTSTFTGTASGGTWSSSNPSVATVSAAGVVSAVASGSATISYTVTAACGSASTTAPLTVSDVPATTGALSGATGLCAGASTTWTDATTGGAWASSNTSVATISAAGVINAVGLGTSTISYTVSNSCGTSTATGTVTVSATPSAGTVTPGSSSICSGTTATLSASVSGGTWSSSSSIATVSATGVVTGVSAGSSTISYSVTNSCGTAVATATVNVSTAPVVAAIGGTGTLCIGSGATLTDASVGGVWSSSNPSVASIDAFGNLTGVAAGSTTIAYTLSGTGCSTTVTATETVMAVPVAGAISGSGTICQGVVTALTNATSGGTWSSSNPSVASVSASGMLTGATAGTATITYTVGSGACSATATATETVNPAPTVTVIAGPTTVCVGGSISLTDATSGGTWTNSTASVATLSGAAVVTGIAPGTDTVHYTVTNSFSCSATTSSVITVNAGPSVAAIGGAGSVCAGSSAALTDATAGGTWSSSASSVASISAGGVVTGVAGGTATISYTVSSGACATTVTATETVSTTPTVAAISGAATMCMSGTTILTDATSGGVWSSSNTAVATISATGLVTPVSMGTTTISYAVASGACSAVATFTETIDTGSVTGTLAPLGSHTLCHGMPVSMNVTASGTGITYQWYLNGTAIAGATNSSYSAAATGAYSVVISNGSCSSSLSGITVVAPPAPVIHAGSGTTIFTGSFASYQWMFNGHAVPGAVGSVYNASAAGTYNVIVTDANGCTDTSATYTVTGTVVNNVPTVNALDIKLYPNPATSVIMVDAPVSVNVTLLTTDGRQIGKYIDTKSIDVSNLASAMYMIMVYDTDGNLLRTDKFIKE